MISNQQRMHVIRLLPKQDLKQVLFCYVKDHSIKAGAVVAVVGSLGIANVRLAQANSSETFKGPFEIVALSGTLSLDGLHLHIGLSDATGKMWGGHLLDGCIVHTTCELVIQEFLDLEFNRNPDITTGYKELCIKSLS